MEEARARWKSGESGGGCEIGGREDEAAEETRTAATHSNATLVGHETRRGNAMLSCCIAIPSTRAHANFEQIAIKF